MKRGAGYTLIEVMIALGISAVIVSAASQLMYQFLKDHSDFREWTDAYIESNLASEELNRILRNSVRIEPGEDMLADGDKAAFNSKHTRLQAATKRRGYGQNPAAGSFVQR